ncbi:O-antigen ligase family protein [Marinobacter sp. ELB17]|uniref:O-antigen ligase family protein n=1 Tax=Marinobacter sp. ELB17 TaxID=270374 RepID=UPI0000F3B290|nr:O-antigen ligase family protein [Marinobacter sp. ELB17]EAZ98667.1 O-antigen polymerase [Marinobacter sp. ELB17]
MSKFALLFLMVFFGGVFFSLFINGSAAFILYQLVYFLNPDNRWWSAQIPGISYSFIASLLMLFALFVKYRFYTERSPWRDQPVFKWIILLLLMYYLMYVFALSPTMHHIFTFNFTKLIVIVFVAYKLLYSERVLNAALWAYILGATYIGYLATITGRNEFSRVEGIGLVDAPDANDTAAAIVPAVVFLMYFAWLGNKKVKILCVVCGAFLANGLVLINSRGSFLGVVGGAGIFLLYMLFSTYQRKGQRGMAVMIIVLGMSGGLYVADEQFWSRMQTLENLDDQETSGSSRVNFWLATFDMLEEHPMGMGVHGYNVLSTQFLTKEQVGPKGNRSVHSLWFQGLSEVGWIGIGIFFCLLISLFRISQKAKAWVLRNGSSESYFKLVALECALLSYLIPATFINRFRAEILYWIILLLMVGINVYFLQRRSGGEGSQIEKTSELAKSDIKERSTRWSQ